MSAEDEFEPAECLPIVAGFPGAALLAECWDDAESDQRNLEAIGWWLSLERDLRARDAR